MYHAIVFLPLVGFLIAGLLGRVIGAAAERDRHDGRSCSSAAALSWVAFFQVGFGSGATRVQVAQWMASGDLVVDWAFRIDTLTAVMLVVVNTRVGARAPLFDRLHARGSAPAAVLRLSVALHLRHADAGDGRQPRPDVLRLGGRRPRELPADRLLVPEGHRPTPRRSRPSSSTASAISASRSASSSSSSCSARSPSTRSSRASASWPSSRFRFLGFEWHALTLACLLLFMGAMGKSAQFLLHTWLPDAMEGPTPVSALIHAATMVTAGVFMVARLSPIFEYAPVALTVVIVIGAITAFFAATVGLVQNDIKRVIAYSTCSQLGYMFVALGVGAYSRRHLPPLHPRLLQGAAVPRRRLGHPRDAPRAGHAEHGRPAPLHPVHRGDDGDRHAGADRLPVHGRLLLQGRDHRGRLRLAPRRRRLRLPGDRRSPPS